MQPFGKPSLQLKERCVIIVFWLLYASFTNKVHPLTVLAPGAHSQFGSGKNTQFEPEQRANPFENVFSKTAVFPPPAIAETDL